MKKLVTTAAAPTKKTVTKAAPAAATAPRQKSGGLTASNTSWKKAKERDPGRGAFEDLEPGVYVVALTDVVMDTFGPKKRLGIRWEFTVQEGDSAGAIQSDFSYLDAEDDVYYTQVRISSMGFEVPEDVDGLKDFLKELADAKPILRVKVVCKDGFTHVYCNKLLDESGGETRTQILSLEKGKKASPKVPPQEPETAIPDDPQPVATRKVKTSKDLTPWASGFAPGDKLSLVEEGEQLTGTFIEDCAEEGVVSLKVDNLEEVWEVNVAENQVEKVEVVAEPPAAAATKKVVKKTKPAAPAVLAVGSKVSFNDGTDDQEGVVSKLNAKAKTAEVDVGDDTYEVPVASLTLL